ncbi:MAG: hypothetical protein H6510_02355 [Acidobacteria bacterium]|nr:hypothetical protein [Acidobacteriota bacterium]MCB9396636.1 hypothetical protein [Acidobacteriota bacterium]
MRFIIFYAFSVFVFGQIPFSERNALLEIYQATNGLNWTQQANWGGPTGSEGTWYGVTVTDGHVTALNLVFNNLTGSDMSALGDLPALVELNLYGNNLSGPFPAELGLLTNLVRMNLSYWQTDGILPDFLGQLVNLEELRLVGCGLDFDLPETFSNLTHLKVLWLHTNNFTGKIPKSWGQMHALEDAGLGLCRFPAFEPTDPTDFGNLTNLDLHANGIQELPNPLFIEAQANLQSLKMHFNWLENNDCPYILAIESMNLTQFEYLPTSGPNIDCSQAFALFDPNLLAILVGSYDLDNNGYVSLSETQGVQMLDLANQGLRDIRGLSAFQDLVNLDLRGNQLMGIDDLIALPNLVSLDVRNNRLGPEACSVIQQLELAGVTVLYAEQGSDTEYLAALPNWPNPSLLALVPLVNQGLVYPLTCPNK